jgi:hypothetical protein
MTKAIALLLQPNRRENETREQYKERRTQANSYVASSLMGTLFWNTDMQGTYFNPERANRPVGKSGHRKAKKLARIAREKVAAGTLVLDVAEGQDQTAVSVVEAPAS